MSSSLTPGGSLTKEGRDKALELLRGVLAERDGAYDPNLYPDIEAFLAEVDARPDA